MKNKLKALCLAFCLLLVAIAASSCGSSVESISISDDNGPRTTYVLGQELDLSVGAILADTGKKTEEVALCAGGV